MNYRIHIKTFTNTKLDNHCREKTSQRNYPQTQSTLSSSHVVNCFSVKEGVASCLHERLRAAFARVLAQGRRRVVHGKQQSRLYTDGGSDSNLTYWLYTVAELIVSGIDNLKTMAGGHAVHERQAIL